MVVLTGRRRLGKTLLARTFMKDKKHLYLFIAKKSENLLVNDLLEEIKKNFNLPIIGTFHSFREIFALLIELSQSEPLTVVIDEFQDFYYINPSVFSDIQNIWDQHKESSKLNVIFIGSIYSLMHKIFMNEKEPLFGRADRIIVLKEFTTKTIREILCDYTHEDSNKLFDYYLFTGGIPKYIDTLVTNNLFDHESILDFFLTEHSPFINEGKNVLIEELGKEYALYFSILELIALGKTSRNDIESLLEKNIGGHLERLDTIYGIISQYKSIDAKPQSRNVRYKINDNFLQFWFRFIHKNKSAVELGNFKYLRDVITRDYTTYAGIVLEKFFHALFRESGKFNKIGSYWEKGNINEIDLVALNDYTKELVIADIKLQKSKLNLNTLQQKAKNITDHYSNYRIRWLGLSLDTPLAELLGSLD